MPLTFRFLMRTRRSIQRTPRRLLKRTAHAADALLVPLRGRLRPSGAIQTGHIAGGRAGTPGEQSSSLGRPAACTGPGRASGTGLISGKTPGQRSVPVWHDGAELAARSFAFARA